MASTSSDSRADRPVPSPFSAIRQFWHRTGIGARTWPTVAALALVSLLAMSPALLSDRVLGGDARAHLLWHAHFTEVFWAGNPFPRWLPDLNHGFGSPVFFIYPPLAQWLGAIWQPLLPGHLHGLTRIVLAMAILSLVGAAGCWLWLRSLGLAPAASVMGALVQLLFPYRYYFDTFHRGALGELAGLAIMPWLLFFLQRLRGGDARGWAGLALAVAGLLFAHLPSALIGVVFAGCYALFIGWDRGWLGFGLRAGSAILCGVAIGAASFVPALTLFRFLANPDNLVGAHQQPMNWLLLSPTGWINDGVWVAVVGLTLLAIALTVALAWIAHGAEHRGHVTMTYFLAGAVAVVVVLNTEASRSFWALQTPLSRIQFPFRLMGIQQVAIAGLAAIAWQALIGRSGKRAGLQRLAIVALLPGLLLVNMAMFAAHTYSIRDRLPPTMSTILAESAEMQEYVLADVSALEATFRGRPVRVVAGQAQPGGVRMGSRHASLTVDGATPSTLALHQYAFSGWECQVDDGAWQAAPPDPRLPGVPSCAVERGRHGVAFRMPATIGERIGCLATAIGLVVALAQLFMASRRRSRLPVDRGL